jgi:hypothetical protein
MPIPLITAYERGPRGSGVITDAGSHWQINADTGQIYRVAKTETSPYVSKVVTGTRVCWQLDSNQAGLWNCGPWSGVYVGKYIGMVMAEGQTIPEPAFKEGGPRKSKHGGNYFAKDRHVFTAKWQLLSTPFEGVETVKQFTYSFYLDNGTVIIRGGKDAARLWNMMEAHGMNMDKETIPAEDNVLPWLDSRLRELNKQVMLKFNEGWVDDITPLPVYADTIVDPDPPEPQPAQAVEQAPPVQTVAQEEIDRLVQERIKELGFSIPAQNNPAPQQQEDPPTAEELKEAAKNIPLPGFNIDFSK